MDGVLERNSCERGSQERSRQAETQGDRKDHGIFLLELSRLRPGSILDDCRRTCRVRQRRGVLGGENDRISRCGWAATPLARSIQMKRKFGLGLIPRRWQPGHRRVDVRPLCPDRALYPPGVPGVHASDDSPEVRRLGPRAPPSPWRVPPRHRVGNGSAPRPRSDPAWRTMGYASPS